MKYNFIERSKNVEKLLAWNPEIKKQLEKDVIQFLNIMPILNEKGLPNSRGIILAGLLELVKRCMLKLWLARLKQLQF